MDNKFKFGDIVRHKRLGLCVVVSYVPECGFMTISNNDGATEIITSARLRIEDTFDGLEIVPHPDTARLNWLEKQMLEDSDQTIVCDGYNGFCTIGNFREHRPPIFENIREAIDHEMKKQGD